VRPPIGGHVGRADPVEEAKAREADLVQFFLADPQGWTAPAPREDATALRASGLTLYVHAPYVVNVATTNNRVRMPSRTLLQQHCDAAGEVGAAAVIVHGGHVSDDSELEAGFDNWRKTFERLESPVPVFIENTAGGNFAMARRFDNLARLWDAIGSVETPYAKGFCLDTCHAHAGGEELAGIVDRVLSITGRVDLVHANDSKDAAGSGRDRHENFGAGQIDPDVLVAVVAACGAPVVCETPGGAEGQAADIAFLRARLPV
jgi:deoxyribonuclease-4